MLNEEIRSLASKIWLLNREEDFTEKPEDWPDEVNKIIVALAPFITEISRLKQELAEAKGPFQVGDFVETKTGKSYGGEPHVLEIVSIKRQIFVKHPEGWRLQYPFEESHLSKLPRD